MKLSENEKEIIVDALEISHEVYQDNDTTDDVLRQIEIEQLIAKLKNEVYIPII